MRDDHCEKLPGCKMNMIRRLGDYCPEPDGPLTQRCPAVHAPKTTDNPDYEVDVSQHNEETVSLYIEPVMAGGIYLTRIPHAVNRPPEPMYIMCIVNDVVTFQDMIGERLTMGINMAREHIVKRFVTKDILEALARSV